MSSRIGRLFAICTLAKIQYKTPCRDYIRVLEFFRTLADKEVATQCKIDRDKFRLFVVHRVWD